MSEAEKKGLGVKADEKQSVEKDYHSIATNTSDIGNSTEEVRIADKYSLTITEAAKYFGIGEKRLYQIVKEHENEDFVLNIGSQKRIKRELFTKYLDRATCV